MRDSVDTRNLLYIPVDKPEECLGIPVDRSKLRIDFRTPSNDCLVHMVMVRMDLVAVRELLRL